MKKVLVINASAKAVGSTSRRLTEIFTRHWKNNHPHPFIRCCELGNTSVPHINQQWIAASFKPAAARTAEDREALQTSDTYITELREADIIVLGSPMYNWSVPSSLKAWIDQIMRVNETFTVNPADTLHPYTGLLQNKTLYLLLSTGYDGYERGGHNEHLNFQSRYLKTVFECMGITQIHVITVSGASIDMDRHRNTMLLAQKRIQELTAMQEA